MLRVLPLAALVYDKQRQQIYVNKKAQQLFLLPNRHSEINKLLSQTQLFHSSSQREMTALEFVNPQLTTLFPPPIHISSLTGTFIIEPHYTILNPQFSLIICTTTSCKETVSDSSDFDSVISKISTQLIDIQLDNLDQKIESALQTIGTFCNADRSYLFQFSDNGKLMSNTHEWVNEHITSFKLHLQNIPQNSLPYFFKTMSEKHVFNIPDVTLMPQHANEEKAEFTAEGIKSVLCIGLKSEQQLVGFIGCDCVKNTRHWNETDLIRIKLVGNIITNALKNVSYKQDIEKIQQQLMHANQELQSLANLDSLTNIANRRQFDNTLKGEIQRSARNQQPISLIICDIDFFKQYNDNFGHQKGDEVLKQVAQALQQLTKRQGGLVARYGGEEFAFILPFTDSASCFEFAKLIKAAMSELAIPHPYSSVCDKLTLSIGYHTAVPTKNMDAKSLIEAADNALYKTKNSGRNKIKAFKQ